MQDLSGRCQQDVNHRRVPGSKAWYINAMKPSAYSSSMKEEESRGKDRINRAARQTTQGKHRLCHTALCQETSSRAAWDVLKSLTVGRATIPVPSMQQHGHREQVEVVVELPAVLAHGAQVDQGVLLSLMSLLQPQLCLLPLPQGLLLHLHCHQTTTLEMLRLPSEINNPEVSHMPRQVRLLDTNGFNALLCSHGQTPQRTSASSTLLMIGVGTLPVLARLGQGALGRGEGQEPTKL